VGELYSLTFKYDVATFILFEVATKGDDYLYCYIQQIKLKNVKYQGNAKAIEPIIYTFNGRTIYSYIMSEERFIRDKNISYKITIQHSYRENGKVKKKQWHVCNMDYYDVADNGFWIGDYMTSKKLEKILNETGLDEETFYNMIEEKLDPLAQSIIEEYQGTEEYKTNKKNQDILSKNSKAKKKFDDKYGYDTYRECYNVFGELMNESRLKELKEQYRKSQEYKRSYYEQYESNYNKQNYSSHFSNIQSSYTEQETRLLKEGFKLLSMKYHPDKNLDKDTTEIMAAINNLKEKILK
jgi:hypothetical protein